MKKILYILTAAIFLLTSCDKQLKFPEKIIGNWYCHSTALTSTDVEIYVTFNSDSFVLYQKVGDGGYRIYNGTYTLTPSNGSYILSGEYNDGTPWGSDYVVESSSNNVMTLTAGEVTETYTRVTTDMPENVKNNAVLVVKSEDTDDLRFF